ncbi:hypothetical protein [Actomonas aquatica]|uniref:Uncharacterized protein n=1 Tax=Actomonas aquatica TaxID=2866162 RepID=A0ABZ1C6V2_9BACT|nr:hypothetical protein [Opitutus sp. WL0086]WRQ87446.1 hypothetical protein K1X11_021745 [Opitutus sp. WL0086]
MSTTSPFPPLPSCPLSDHALAVGETHLKTFLAEQLADYGAEMEIAPGCWALMAFERHDSDADLLARAVLETASFPWTAGCSDDDAWIIFYVRSAEQATARHWLDHLLRWLDGRPPEPSPAHLAELRSLYDSPMPHRVARGLVVAAQQGELPPALARTSADVRALLDRLHRQEPTFLSALLLLLENHLIDLLELYRVLTQDDLDIINELTSGNVSQDPFLLNRQTAASGLRRHLIDAKILNPLDQRKHTEATNPYAQIVRLRAQTDGRVLLRMDGNDQPTTATSLHESLLKIRQRENRGIDALAPGSRAPWAVDDRAYHLRFVRNLIAEHPHLRPADVLHMVERALPTSG